MDPVSQRDLDSIAPYTDGQYWEAMCRFVKSPAFPVMVQKYYPGLPADIGKERALQLKTVEQFQKVVIAAVIQILQERTTRGVTLEGMEALSKTRRYLYVSNHRDIILDPAVFARAIHAAGYTTPQICLGDNLLTDPMIIDLIKMNKGVTVKRNLAPRDLLHWSVVLSEWIRRQITEDRDSIWIAQREGRAKDGRDLTQPGVLKMFALTGEGTFLERLKRLHLVPVAISYEYDPSDVQKAVELHAIRKTGSYQKKPGEDQRAIGRGVEGFKGGIHLRVGAEVSADLELAEKLRNKNEQAAWIASFLDDRIRAQYRNWPSNYVAADLLSGGSQYSAQYQPEQKEEFVARLEKRL